MQEIFSLSKSFSDRIARLLSHQGGSPAKVAAAVKQLSQYFNDERGTTPWGNPETSLAYLAYFLPLNVLRSQRVVAEAQRFGFFASHGTKVIDFGSGPGTTFWALTAQGVQFTDSLAIESHKEAAELAQSLEPPWSSQVEWRPSLANCNLDWSDHIGVFSYSLNELGSLPLWAHKLSALILIEPSTRTRGRQLMQLREELLSSGFHIWAPCTHADNCPLLHKSQRDWCHDRIMIERPEWLQKIESHLPMENRSVTYSYLIASRQPSPEIVSSQDVARVIGDTQHEKGKTKQMICRGPEREFLTWLKRHGDPARIPRGDIIRIPPTVEKKGDELRCLIAPDKL